MVTIINNQFCDPYKNDLDYELVESRNNVTYNGVVYDNKKVYEKKLDLLAKIGQIFYAVVVTLAIIPMVCYPDYFREVWKNAVSGVEKQIVLFKFSDDPPIELQAQPISSEMYENRSGSPFYIDLTQL